MKNSFNGWKNYETWNVALWLQNDEGLYSCAQEAPSYGDWMDFVFTNGLTSTPDGVDYDHQALDYKRLDELVKSID